MTMTTKELLALVGKWRERADERMAMYEPNDFRECADELAPLTTALCAEVEALRKVLDAASALMAYRVGEYPLRGDLRDNDASRAQIDALATAIDAARSRNEHEG